MPITPWENSKYLPFTLRNPLMSRIPMPNQPTAFTALTLVRAGGKVTMLNVGRDQVLFFETRPIACITGGYVYFPSHEFRNSETRVINDFHPSSPHVRVAPREFDFVIAGLLSVQANTIRVSGPSPDAESTDDQEEPSP